MSEEDVQTVVIDNGSGIWKACFSGDEAPRSVFPSVVGRPKFKQQLVGGNAKDVFIGDEALLRAYDLILKHPIERGIVKNWDDMEKIWHHAFYNELRVDPTEHPVLLTEAVMTPKANCEKMISLMFDTFNVPSFYVGNQAVLSLYASGRSTGIVLQSGYGISQFVPVHEVYPLRDCLTKIDFAGCDLNEWMLRLYEERTLCFHTTVEKEMVRDIKEKLCYVALDYDAEMEKAATSSEINRTYELINGNVITMGEERFRCPELLFKPYLYGLQYDGIDQILFDTIMKCDEYIRKDLFANIILAGGTTMFEGFAERLEKEITARAPHTMKVNIVDPLDRKYAALLGGSILASLTTFPEMVVTKEEYDEVGSSIVHSKCL